MPQMWRSYCNWSSMAKRISRPIRLIPLVLIHICLMGLMGCSTNQGSTNQQGQQNGKQFGDAFTAQGGYDLGGGDAIHSPPALVIRTIEMVQSLAGEELWEKNVFKHYFITFGRNGWRRRFKTRPKFPEWRRQSPDVSRGDDLPGHLHCS